MKKTLLALFALFYTGALFSKSAPLLFATSNTGYCHIINLKKSLYCITQQAIYKIEKSNLHPVLSLPVRCHEATVYHDTLLLATDEGIKKWEPHSTAAIGFLPKQISGIITHIQTDETGAIWFTKEFEGCYKISNGKEVQQIVNVPVVYSLAHTRDSLIWVGTNVGLYKVPVSGKEIERYAEEGIADNELPDNLVEQLFAGASKGVWAVMPGHVSYIVSGQDEEEPDLENIGNKDNKLFGIAEMPAFGESFLFSTAEGVLYVPKFKNNDIVRTGEIHQTIHETAYRLTDEVIQKPAALGKETVQKIQFVNGTAWFVTHSGIWSLPVSELIRKMKKEGIEIEKPGRKLTIGRN